MVTWSSTDYLQQKSDIALAMGQLGDFEKQVYAVTLHKSSRPTEQELADKWRSVVGNAPDLGAKMQWWDTVNSQIGDVFVYNQEDIHAEFVPIDPAPNLSWQLFDNFYQNATDASADWVVSIPQTHKHLFLQLSMRSLDVTTIRLPFKLRVNNDTGANYRALLHGLWDGSIQASGTSTNNEARFWFVPAYLDNGIDDAGMIEIFIPNYCSGDALEHALHGYSASVSGSYSGATKFAHTVFDSNFWLGTDDITELTFMDDAGFSPGTRISVWGVYPK